MVAPFSGSNSPAGADPLANKSSRSRGPGAGQRHREHFDLSRDSPGSPPASSPAGPQPEAAWKLLASASHSSSAADLGPSASLNPLAAFRPNVLRTTTCWAHLGLELELELGLASDILTPAGPSGRHRQCCGPGIASIFSNTPHTRSAAASTPAAAPTTIEKVPSPWRICTLISNWNSNLIWLSNSRRAEDTQRAN